ncbi:MAG TPA: alkene reductase [Solirubrobacteraceae bacterium]|nr:alkene reductase [Solirubrobacteraceae bacterium]
MPFDAFFSPTTVGHLELPNRIVMAPMTRSRSNAQGVPPTFAAEYYAQRADCGLIISEATNVSPQAVGYALTPGIWSAAQVEAWKPVTEAVHERDGRILLQLWHTGRISHPDLHGGELPVAPSAITPQGQAFTADGMKDHVQPRALETHEIPAIVEDYRRAAENARAAGFDGVEVHSANNYLLEQFLRDSTNRREDEYGGSLENRLRFPLAVVAAVVDVWGAGRVGIRISPATTQPGQTPLDSDVMGTYGTYLDRLTQLGLAYTHVIEGITYTSREWPEGISFAELRERAPGAYIANNELDVAEAARLIEAGDADLVSFARAYIANPDLVERIRVGGPLAEAPKQYWYGGDATGYADWPALATQNA